MKTTLGPDLEAAKSRGGGYGRVEPSGTQFLRSICKLTHIGRTQYAKGNAFLPLTTIVNPNIFWETFFELVGPEMPPKTLQRYATCRAL